MGCRIYETSKMAAQPSGKAAVCKTVTHRFKSGCRLQLFEAPRSNLGESLTVRKLSFSDSLANAAASGPQGLRAGGQATGNALAVAVQRQIEKQLLSNLFVVRLKGQPYEAEATQLCRKQSEPADHSVNMTEWSAGFFLWLEQRQSEIDRAQSKRRTPM